MAEDDVRGPDPVPQDPSAPEADPAPATGVPDPAPFYAQRRPRRWPWVAAPVAVAVLVAGGFVVHERTTTAPAVPAPTAAPVDPTAVVPPAPGELAGFALAGAGDVVVHLQTAGAVQRADLASGAATVTPTPGLAEPSSFFAGPGWVASKTVGATTGVLVRDGGRAQVLPVSVQQAGSAYPGPGGGIWVLPQQSDRNGGRTAVLVDVEGDRVGDTSIRVPDAVGLPVGHLTGALVTSGTAGTYEAGPEGTRRLSRGTLLGLGTDAVLSWDCNTQKRCDARVNRPGKAPRYLPAVHKSLLGLYADDVAAAATGRGVLSPDGAWLALELPKPTRSGARLVLVELSSGHRVEVPGALADRRSTDQAAWTPNGRYLLTLTDGRLRVFDATTEKVATVGGTPADLRHLTIAGTATM
ncbi:hypothetical protein GCM10022197_02810 [Microlunatus spumicola]|uniref:Uncharacterized protein n=1 Tax=Microlunatus spumicola TaxID=81499 RepID=A0ABP6WIW9_9ACTN